MVKHQQILSKFYDSSYKINFEKKSNNTGHITIKAKNAYVHLVVKNETYDGNGGYSGYNGFNIKNYHSNVRVSSLYRRKNQKKPQAPQKFTRKMLCYAITYLCEHGMINNDSIIALEPDPSPNNNLVNKVYIPMGFQIIGILHPGVYLMSSNIRTTLSWCDENY